MNVDIGDLLSRIKIKDPVTAGGVASAVVSVLAFFLSVTSAVRAMAELDDVQAQYSTARNAIQQIRRMQEASPGDLRGEISRAKARFQTLLADIPTSEEATAELVRFYEYADESDAQLVRVEKLMLSTEEEAEPSYTVEQFVLDARGEVPNLMRFLALVGGGPHSTFILDNITIDPNSPAEAAADLTIYYSDLGRSVFPAAPTTPVTPTEEVTPTLEAGTPALPTPEAGDEAEISKLEKLMTEALAARNWALAVVAGERILELDPERFDIAEALHGARLSWGRELASQDQGRDEGDRFEEALKLVTEGKGALADLREAQPTESPEAPIATPSPVQPTPTVGPASQLSIHVVRAGESLSLIAARYETTVSEIMRINKLADTTIYVGQRLAIPVR